MNRDIEILREVVMKLTPLLAGRKIVVTQRGTRAYVATNAKTLIPERVNIPFIPDNADQKLILAIQGFIDHEVGHVLHTDFKWNLKAQNRGEQFRSLWNILEDTFIERRQAETFKGCGYNLAKLHEFFISDITTPALKAAEDKGDTATMFGVLLVPIARAWSGQGRFQDYLDGIKAWTDPRLQARIDRIRPIQGKIAGIKSSEDSYNLAEELRELLKAPKVAPPPPPPAPPEEEKAEDDEGEPNGGKGETPEDEGEGPAENPPEAPKPPQEKRKPRDDEPPAAGAEDEDEDEDDGQFDEKGDGKDPLTPFERRVLTARFDRAKSFEEIARAAKKPLDDIEQAYDRAMTKLKTGFGEAA